ncbi:MAG TPA: DUF309 domain-containing protein [Polyangiaceae bacterium LLY-WYZ-15_(1-7)]|nr:DUF309 domain-containing protein [Polyangiaceae bacterium LLY-WYZ-15_(1-7)]HJL01674.1 DUF309 domain-containing protein [Polyangiaceae bacterium LLY-WYZ-15_(1-7)]HJL08714.1 DUF309 domain-containing protein [Polyangiaceae bacterium LLY-WYZ-15_(1-7)]HJL25297.1 DUF309 domain-containing protein [Polyangiaceae bacterium LLY-WYZ-15_(1-7)]HJL46917.1 DUF309 domain-containing protein [Polyangiaceae bacterium LLY-WYZ-15_(1-7)]
MTLAEALEAGRALYRAGEPFEAHEVWEDAWRPLPRGPERTLLQGLIQLAAAAHKLRSGERVRGAPRLLRKAAAKLRRASGALGVDGAALGAECEALAERLEERLARGEAIAGAEPPEV